MSRTLASTLILLGCVGAASAQPPRAVFVVNGVRVQQGQALTEEEIERLIFRPHGTAAGVHQQLESQLAMQIADIDRACALTAAETKKLRLAGQGDIKRFFDRSEAMKQKVRLMQNDNQMFPQILLQCIRPLQLELQTGLFHEDSLMVKSLPNTLTSEQFARYDAMARERRASRHRQSGEKAIAILGQKIVLRDAQRRELVALIANETKPPRRFGPYEAYALLLQLDRLPHEKLKRLFDQDQWERVSEQLAQCHQLEPMLREVGQWPIEGDEAESMAK